MTDHKVIYGIVGAVLAVLLIVMLVTFDYDRKNDEALAKADQLIAAYDAAGLTPPEDRDEVAELMGDDGGSFCAVDYDGQYLGQLKNRLGVGGEFFFRAGPVDERVYQGLEIIVSIYCPDKLPDLQDLGDDLSFDDVVKN